jgi:peptide-methionine (S)-S-oxide reductase
VDGVQRTRVGYAGGTIENPTYGAMGDHTETLQIDFDPQVVTFEELLRLFWESHDSSRQPWSRQYMSLILAHDRNQLRAAEERAGGLTKRLGRPVHTRIEPLERFTWAEDYHQKYYLKNIKPVAADLYAVYPRHADFVNSKVAARLNGYAGGYGSAIRLRKELSGYGLSPEAEQAIFEYAGRRFI